MPPKGHALISASAIDRVLSCTASVRATQGAKEKPSEFAAEGSLAHEACELNTRQALGYPLNTTWAKLKADSLWQEEMVGCAEDYTAHIQERMSRYESPLVELEVKVKYTDWVPEGFGTSDCVIAGKLKGSDEWGLEIIDYKHGKGVPRYAAEQTLGSPGDAQLCMYLLGTLQTYRMIYGDVFSKAWVSIVQPRIDNTNTAEIDLSELYRWADEVVRPRAHAAYTGEGAEFSAGAHCRFCKIKATCRAREEYFLEPEKFLTRSSEQLSDAEIGEVLERAKTIASYITDVEEYVSERLNAGETIPGWKLVEGRSNRKIANIDAAFTKLTTLYGIEEPLLYEKKPISLGAVEKLVGKKNLPDMIGEFIIKPEGKPTLVPESDKRPALGSAAADFAGLI